MKKHITIISCVFIISILLNTSTIWAQNPYIINVEKPGGLYDALPDNIYEDVYDIKISGNLNSDDMRTIRALCGGNEYGYADPGILKKIDLADANLVKGGNYFAEIVDTDRKLKKHYVEQSNELPDKLFYSCASIQEIILPKNITTIGIGAFFDCVELQSVVIPDQVTTIKSTAFGDCLKLKTLQLPSKLNELGAYMFIYCKKLEEITIPQNVKRLNTCSFQESGLKKIILPQQMEWIAPETFIRANCLEEISISTGIKNIEKATFYGCSNLRKVTLPSTIEMILPTAFQDCPKLETVNFPEGLVEIRRLAFANCSALKEVLLPSTMQKVEMEAFTKCSSISRCQLGGTQSIGEMAFWHCMNLTSLEIPERMEEIGNSAFAECMGLKSITIKSNDLTLISNPFLGCMNLETFNVNNGNTQFMEYKGGLYNKEGTMLYSFANKSSKQCTMHPNTIATDNFALWFCTNIESVEIPDTFRTFGRRALCGSKEIKTITMHAKEPIEYDMSSDPFEGLNTSECDLLVPSESIDKYRASTLWNRFKISELLAINTPSTNGVSINILSDRIHISNLSSQITQVTLYNSLGEQLKSVKVRDREATINTNQIAQGYYILLFEGTTVRQAKPIMLSN